MPLNNASFIITPDNNINVNPNLSNEKEIGSDLWNALGIDAKFQEAYEASGKNILPMVIESDNSKILQNYYIMKSFIFWLRTHIQIEYE